MRLRREFGRKVSGDRQVVDWTGKLGSDPCAIRARGLNILFVEGMLGANLTYGGLTDPANLIELDGVTHPEVRKRFQRLRTAEDFNRTHGDALLLDFCFFAHKLHKTRGPIRRPARLGCVIYTAPSLTYP